MKDKEGSKLIYGVYDTLRRVQDKLEIIQRNLSPVIQVDHIERKFLHRKLSEHHTSFSSSLPWVKVCSPMAYSRKDITLLFSVLNALKSRSVKNESPKAPSRPRDSRNCSLKVTNYSKIVLRSHYILSVGIRSEVLQICLQILYGIPQFILVSQRKASRATANASISICSSMTFYQDRMGK